MAKKRRPRPRVEHVPVAELRIIGGKLRGSRIAYNGDPGTRPMKERVREAIFNLIGPAIRGSHAIDVFAGTGALGLEALSRGAVQATFVERHLPTSKTLQENINALEVAERCQLFKSDSFFWMRDVPSCLRGASEAGSPLNELPWVVFCAPPYVLYRERKQDMLDLVSRFVDNAPQKSSIIVEADGEFDFAELPLPQEWDVRTYSPAVVGIWRSDWGEEDT